MTIKVPLGGKCIINYKTQWNTYKLLFCLIILGCGLDKLQWDEVEKRLRNVFQNDDIEVDVYVYSPGK